VYVERLVLDEAVATDNPRAVRAALEQELTRHTELVPGRSGAFDRALAPPVILPPAASPGATGARVGRSVAAALANAIGGRP
jgi:hypothetical protein